MTVGSGKWMLAGLCSLALLFQAPPASAASLEELAGPEGAARLRAGETLSSVQFKPAGFELLPAHGGVKALAEAIRRELEPGVLAETLGIYKKPGPAGPWTGAEKAALFNGAAAISSLAGTEYYSASRGTMRTFYESSTVIDGPDSKKPLPDPFFAAPPRELSLYARQKDLSFGNNIYRYDYRVMDDAIVFVQENLTAMTYGIIPAVGKNKLRSLVAVIDAGDCLLFYGVSAAKAASLPGMKERIGDSFSNRALAILKWYSGHADRAFAR